MIPLYQRRTTIGYIVLRLKRMSATAPILTPSSMLRFGKMCKAIWFYLDAVRQSEVNQPVADQQQLAGIEAAVRNLMVQCLRFYPNATGARDLSLTQDSSAAIDQILAYDPTTTATFDLEGAVLRVLRGALII